MQKILSSFLLAAITAVGATAQISITSARNPSAGMVITTRAVDSAWLVKQDFGMPGPNRSWNFANPVYNGTASELVRYVEVSATPYASKFPDATIANILTFEDITDYGYFRATPTQLIFLGSANITGVVTASPPIIVWQFPTNYQSAYKLTSDLTVDGAFLLGTQVDSVVADAWGSITTPLGAFQCLRLVQHTTVFVEKAVFVRVVATSWHTTQHPHPIFEYVSEKIHGAASLSGHMLVSATTGINDPDWAAAIQVSPNPASSRALLTVQSDQQRNVDVQIYNSMGQLVKTLRNVSLSVGDSQIELAVDDFATGNYTLLLIDKNRLMGFQRLAVQH